MRLTGIMLRSSMLCLMVGCSHANMSTTDSNHSWPPVGKPGNRCPDGHTTLKDVPIIYGLLAIDTPEQKEKLNQAIKSYRIWPGGCVSTIESPKVRVTCTTCGFGFEAEFNHWSRSSPELASFTRPFSHQTSTFPKPSKPELKDTVEYNQSVYRNEVIDEGLSYTSTEDRDTLIASINRWFKNTIAVPPPPSEREVTALDGTEKLITEWNAEHLSVMLYYSKKKQECRVMLFVTRSDLAFRDLFEEKYGAQVP
jgi:hypothetical protein